MPEDFDRRAFFRSSLRKVVRAAADSYEAMRDPYAFEPRPAPPRIRPPGAMAEGDFLARCTLCNDCVTICPAQCITHVPPGHADAGTPVIVPSLRACVLCTDLHCTQVCEPGALRPLSSPTEVRIGLAEVDRSTCVTWQDATCTVCEEACPTDPKAIELDGGHPQVRADLCTGCGVCEERCPVRPAAIVVRPVAGPGV